MIGPHILKVFPFPVPGWIWGTFHFANTIQKCQAGIVLMFMVHSMLEVGTPGRAQAYKKGDGQFDWIEFFPSCK